MIKSIVRAFVYVISKNELYALNTLNDCIDCVK